MHSGKPLRMFIAGLALAATAGAACAGNTDGMEITRIAVPGVGTVPYQQLFEAVSEPGEALDAFMLRVAPRLRAYSDATGYEACGVIARNDQGQYGVVVGTNHAHIACVNLSRIVPAGMRATGETIHSHGGDRAVAASKVDLQLMGKRLAKMGGTTRAIITVHGQKLDAFSPTDFEGGPGYLAAPEGRLLHQSGKGTTREVR